MRFNIHLVQTDTNDGVVQNSKVITDFVEWVDCELDTVIDTMPRIVRAEIIEKEANVGGTAFAQGHLKISTKNFGSQVFAKISKNGNLQIFGENVNRYYINANGHLIYKYCNE